MRTPTLSRGLLFLPLFLVVHGCGDCGGTPDVDDAGGHATVLCASDGDCPTDQFCMGGVCEVGTVGDGDGDGDGDADGGIGDGDGDGDGDAGVPVAELTVLPDTTIEFGAQLVGVPVTRAVTLLNSGTKALTILALILDDNSGEFSSVPSGTLSEVLAPGDSLVVDVSHTPLDGQADTATLKVLHDAPGNLTNITLFAEFKGDAELSISDDLTVITPSQTTLDFGEVQTGVPTVRTLYVRNTGAADSLLTVTNLTITPPSAGFSIDGTVAFPVLLNAWSRALCPSGDTTGCPADAASCTDQVCTDDEGNALHTLEVPVAFVTSGLAGAATLTITTNVAGQISQTDVALTGLPTQPNLVVSPSSVSFGNTLVGAPSSSIDVTISNPGQGALLITKVVLPTQAAFTTTPSAPIPTADGQLPYVIAPNGTPLVLTVTFTPTDPEGYAGFITLHTNMAGAIQFPIPISGNGVVCPLNAIVTPAGECACAPGFNDCAGGCIANGPSSCGSACTDCTAYSPNLGTNASCQSDGTCAFSCTAPYYDLDNDISQPPTTSGWDGCEYLCPQNPPAPFEICNGIDDNCNGVRDEGLQPDVSDQIAANSTCATATNLGDVDATTNGATNTWQRSIYPTGDNDWFKIRVREGTDNPSCIEEIPCIEGGTEKYRTHFSLTAPSGESYALEVLVPTPADYDTCTGTTLTNANNTITHEWIRASNLFSCALCIFDIYCYPGGYGCAFDDSQIYYVRVRASPSNPQSFSCAPYTLSVTTTALPPGS